MAHIINKQQNSIDQLNPIETMLKRVPDNITISLTDLKEDQIYVHGGFEGGEGLALTLKALARALFENKTNIAQRPSATPDKSPSEQVSWLQQLLTRLHRILAGKPTVQAVDESVQIAGYLAHEGSINSMLFRYAGEAMALKKLGKSDRVILLTSTLHQSGQFITNTGHLQHLVRIMNPNAANRALDWIVQVSSEVNFAALIDTSQKRLLETSRKDETTSIIIDDELCADISSMFSHQLQSAARLRIRTLSGTRIATASELQLDTGLRTIYCARIPFLSNLVVIMVRSRSANSVPDWQMLHGIMNDFLRDHIGRLMTNGLQTITLPFPETQKEFAAIVEELRLLKTDDLIGRLRIGGFLNHPMTFDDIEQRCKECIYYLPHRKWCDLPELPLPVEPEWWCRLWKL
jgi:hypothetical protein